ncbi:MAG: hypothetical protein Tsb009_11770 [Planctomycetaceae bacterium]
MSGIEFTYRNGEEAGHYSILESLGGGVALLDYDADGLLDIFIPGGGHFGPKKEILSYSPVLYRNLGNWKFQDVTQEAGLKFAPYYSHGVAVDDYDHDGFPDILVTGYGGLTFFHNRGDGTFEERAKPAGLTDKQWSSTAAWGDLNGDGSPDLYVAHYVNWSWENDPPCYAVQDQQREVCPPKKFKGLSDIIYLSNGDGTFQDATRQLGLKREGKGLGALIGDFDLNGQLDIFVANDEEDNFLYRNTVSGKFQEIGMVSGTSRGDDGRVNGSMGIDIGDFNGDGLPDLWIANYERESFALLRNEQNCLFTHVGQSLGITSLGGLYVGWGTAFIDFDRDGDLDIFVSNGHVIRHPVNAPVMQKPILLENQNGKRFKNISATAGEYFRQSHMGRGLAAGDLDDDGDVDIVISRTNQPVAVLENETPNSNSWIQFRLIGTKSCRHPVGAIVTVKTSSGKKQVKQIKSGSSYASTNDPRLFFGLGTSKVESVEIRWPSGQVQHLDSLAADQTHIIIEQRTPIPARHP